MIAALKLTPEQQQRIKAMEADMFMGPFGPGGPGGPKGSPPPDGTRGGPRRGPDDSFRGSSEKVLAVLTEDQRQKWNQLTGKPFVHRRGGPFRNGRPLRRLRPTPTRLAAGSKRLIAVAFSSARRPILRATEFHPTARWNQPTRVLDLQRTVQSPETGASS